MAKSVADIMTDGEGLHLIMTKDLMVTGLRQVADKYETFIIDLWGVLHDGVKAFPEAVVCLEALKRQGAKIIILSNAPRRASEVAARNEELGIDPALVDFVMSSGEATWQSLNSCADAWYAALGKACFHLGPERDHGIREGLDYDFVPALEDADFILLTGPTGFNDTVEDYRPLLEKAKGLKLPMVCANPDREVIRDGKREICGGAVALAYEEMGGEIRYHGKPDAEIYDACLLPLAITDRSKVLAVGDSLRTDIAGARRSGIDALFVAGGIHAKELGMDAGQNPDPTILNELLAKAPEQPNGILPHLSW